MSLNVGVKKKGSLTQLMNDGSSLNSKISLENDFRFLLKKDKKWLIDFENNSSIGLYAVSQISAAKSKVDLEEFSIKQKTASNKEYLGGEDFLYKDIGPLNILNNLTLKSADIYLTDVSKKKEKVAFEENVDFLTMDSQVKLDGLKYQLENKLVLNDIVMESKRLDFEGMKLLTTVTPEESSYLIKSNLQIEESNFSKDLKELVVDIKSENRVSSDFKEVSGETEIALSQTDTKHSILKNLFLQS